MRRSLPPGGASDWSIGPAQPPHRPSRHLARGWCLLALIVHAGLAIPAPASAAPPAVVPQFPHDQTLVPGRLYFRQVGLGRNGHIDWHNGSLYTANVTGSPRREFRFANPSDPGSLFVTGGAVPGFSEHDTHGHTKVGDWLGPRIKRVGVNANTLDGDRRPAFTQPIPARAVGGRARQHTIYFPWATPFHWNQYGDSNGWGWVYRGNQLLHEWDLVGQTGILGNSILLGNLLFIVSHEEALGVAALDLTPMFETPPRDPILLDKLSGNLGAYLAAIWQHYIILARRDNRTLQMIDISDPRNLRLAATIPLYQNASNVPYVQFQDHHAFVWGNKVNLETRQVELVLDAVGNGQMDAGFQPAAAFVPRPPGSVAGALDVSQYNLPLGNLVITGAYSATGRDGIGVWAHQAAPDTRAPFVGYHVPRPGQTSFPRGAPISLVINETLESPTIINGDTITLRRLGASTPVDCWVSFSHDDVLTLTPKQYLDPDTTYEVIVAAGGIKDAVGNGIAPYSFTFSTGTTATGGNQSPVVTAFHASPARAQPGATVTFTAAATDPEGDALEYRFLFGDGTAATNWSTVASVSHPYAAVGHFDAKLQVRDLKPDGATSQVTTTRTISITPPAPARQPTRSGPLVLDDAGRRIFTVNPDHDSLTAVNADTLEKIYEVDLRVVSGLAAGATVDPRNVALDAHGRLWISARGADAIIVLDAANGALAGFHPLGYGAAPFGIVASPDGATIFATLEARGSGNRGHGQLVRYSAATRAETGRRDLGPTPRALAMTSDGGRLFVTRFISAENHGEIWEVNPGTLALTRTIPLFRDRGNRSFDTGSAGKGVPNYVASITISPDDRWAWFTAHKANTQRGAFFDQGTGTNQHLSPDGTVRALVGRIDLTTNNEPRVTNWADAATPSRRLDVDNSDSPVAVTFTPEGDYAFVALQGNNAIAVFDHLDLLGDGPAVTTWRFATGAAPQGLVYDATRGRLIVQNFLDRDLGVHEIAGFVGGGERANVTTRVPVVDFERLAPEVHRGKKLFYHASDRMSLETYISCATCHVDGSHDGRVYDFTQRGEGLRNTADLRGRGGVAHGNVHWTANFDETQDFIVDIVDHFGGTGFLAEGQSPHPPLGSPNAGRSADLDALAAYLASLDARTVPRSPHREADGSRSLDARLGAAVFAAQNCTACHAPAFQYTHGTAATLHDVGTLRTSSGQRLGGPLGGIDAPTLLGTWQSGPWLHDGSAETLGEIFLKAGGDVIQAETGALSSTSTSVIQVRSGDDAIVNYDSSAQGSFVEFKATQAALTFSGVHGGVGGTGALEFRYESSAPRSWNVIVNGVTHVVTVPYDFNTRMEWRRAHLPGVALTAGATNTIVVQATSGGVFRIDSMTVSTADHLQRAEAHRRVLALSPDDRRRLEAYLLALDGTDIDGDSQPVVTSGALPDATEHRAFRFVFSAAGGDGDRRWSLAQGDLPPGLTLHAVTGELTGTPTDFGDFPLTIAVTDANGSTTSVNRTLFVAPAAPDVGAASARHVQDESSGRLVIEAERAAEIRGTLAPAWVQGSATDASAGTYMGTPDTPTAGTVLDSNEASHLVHPVTFTRAGDHRLWVRSRALTTGGTADSVFYQIDDGPRVRLNTTNALTWAWVQSAATISIPAAGDYSLRIYVRENGTQVDKLVLAPDGTAAPSGPGPVETYQAATSAMPAITTLSLPPGTIGESYSASLEAAGGDAPLVWSLAEAPAGLSIHPATGAISGRPETSGNQRLRARVVDATGDADEHAYTALIAPRPSPYEDWADGHAWPSDVSDARLPGADPDRDGLPNILEYAIDTDPLVSTAPAAEAHVVSGTLRLTYRRARAELLYSVETSVDLQTWTTQGVAQDTTTPVGGVATASIPLTNSDERRYLRLRVSSP